MTSPAAPARSRLQWFQDLMRHRIMEILLVAPPYDSFVLEESGELAERMLGEFRNLDLHYPPGLTAVATGEEALARLAGGERFELVVTTPQLADVDAVELARQVRAGGHEVPVVLLARDGRELAEFTARQGLAGLERAFLWQGDARILVAIVKSVEDRLNAPHDCRELGVPVLLLVEDGVRQYSSFLPAMYAELHRHAQRVIAEGLNLSQKILRMRARPKILLCTTWEEAAAAFDTYADLVLGIVADLEFPRDGALSRRAGADFTRRARASHPDIPVILHSSQPDNRTIAESLGARFLLKGSPHLLQDLRGILLEDFGFGDFVFRLPDGVEVDRAADLRTLEEKLATVPEAAIVHHAGRNHFSRWLKARGVFAVGEALRPRRPEDFPEAGALRRHLARAIAEYRREQARTLVADFDRATFDLESDFYRIGGGSLGGKARGLAFVRRLLAERELTRRFTGVEITVPAAVVLGTDVFDRFLDENGLRHFAIECDDDAEIVRRFAAARFPGEAALDLAAFLERARFPLAVRSSSLLEDNQRQPFTGVYETFMLANDAEDPAERLRHALAAIRRVYASTFGRAAKAYLRATTYRLEEERMAVIVQRVVGAPHGNRFYPTLAGVARSVNFYPTGPMRSADGIAAVALGLGRIVVEGGACLRFSPRHPQNVPQLASLREALATTQRRFLALPLGAAATDAASGPAMREIELGLEAAEADGELAHAGSTGSPDDDRLVDGLARSGTRIVSFAPILKHGRVPLAPLLTTLLEEGARGMGAPVEIEFALRLAGGTSAEPDELGLLQMRPLAVASGGEAPELGAIAEDSVLCASSSALGNGRIEGITDLVLVDPRRFDRARSRESAGAIGRLNARLLTERRPYVLVGLGRWGSRDPWLGIPVGWEQVHGARVIVEAGLPGVSVAPSQGSHFFQNLTSFEVGYLTVGDADGGHVDWEWLAGQPALAEEGPVRHLRFTAPLTILMDGRRGRAVVLKPGAVSGELSGS